MGNHSVKPWHKEALELRKNHMPKEVFDILIKKYPGIHYNTVRAYLYAHYKAVTDNGIIRDEFAEAPQIESTEVLSDWQEEAIHMVEANKSLRMIFTAVKAKKPDVTFTEVREFLKKKGLIKNNYVSVESTEPDIHDNKWKGSKQIKFALMGDTQFGSKYAQITHLYDFYNRCKEEGITTVYHTGDVVDGLKMRTGHEYELYVNGYDEMLNDVIDNYPQIDGITTYFITGNHDASIYKQIGLDIGSYISDARKDMVYLGRDCAQVYLTPKCILELRHPWDGTAYAQSYKPQKMIEAMESDSKPNILAIGHYHKAEYLFYRNVHSIQTGCFQSQTPFTRGKGISIALGGWIITADIDEDGQLEDISMKFIPFYNSVKDDYKNWR